MLLFAQVYPYAHPEDDTQASINYGRTNKMVKEYNIYSFILIFKIVIFRL